MSNETITSPKGFKAGSAACGLKASGKLDVAVLSCETGATCAACFTTNTVQAAPVQISREHMKSQTIRGVVVNSGNANACTGQQGLADASAMTQRLGEKLNVPSREILVGSTGVIGHELDMAKINAGIDQACESLSDSEQAGLQFTEAIMTTDTRPKRAYREFEIDGKLIHLAGTVKGSGMIRPNMATMLAFITTDARISQSDLRSHLAQAVGRTFNRITVDGEMSTNDTVMVLASGLACDEEIGSAWQSPFGENLYELCNELAMSIVSDGEGATKVFHVMVTNAENFTQAHTVARAVAESLLVKTAIHGSDPNWGRIVSAAGASGASFNPQKAQCAIGGVTVFDKGLGVDHDAKKLDEIMTGDDIWIMLDLRDGEASDIVHSCDLSKGYVDINALYHT